MSNNPVVDVVLIQRGKQKVFVARKLNRSKSIGDKLLEADFATYLTVKELFPKTKAHALAEYCNTDPEKLTKIIEQHGYRVVGQLKDGVLCTLEKKEIK